MNWNKSCLCPDILFTKIYQIASFTCSNHKNMFLGGLPPDPPTGVCFGHFTTFMAYEFACLHYVWPYNFIKILLVFYIFFKIKVFCTRHCLEQIICNIMVMKVGWRGPLGIFAYGPHRLSNHHWPLLTGNQYDSFICILQFNS